MSDNTYNIPTMSTGTMAKQLTELYTQAYRNHTLPFLPSVALWGPMGVGKSTAVKTIAENLSKGFQQHIGVTDIRLLNFSPIDLRGIPSADINKEFTVWLKPKIFDLPKNTPHILFLPRRSPFRQLPTRLHWTSGSESLNCRKIVSLSVPAIVLQIDPLLFVCPKLWQTACYILKFSLILTAGMNGH